MYVAAAAKKSLVLRPLSLLVVSSSAKQSCVNSTFFFSFYNFFGEDMAANIARKTS